MRSYNSPTSLGLQTGTRIGPYAILGLLGAGGTGEVCRAHDGRLDRDVALKIVPEALATDANRLARFERDARGAIGFGYGLDTSLWRFTPRNP